MPIVVFHRFPALTPARARSRAREVPRNAAQWHAHPEGGSPSIPTLRLGLEGYLASRPDIAARTRSEYRRCFERHAPQWLDWRLDELGRNDVERRFLALSKHPGPSAANAFVKLLGAVSPGGACSPRMPNAALSRIAPAAAFAPLCAGRKGAREETPSDATCRAISTSGTVPYNAARMPPRHPPDRRPPHRR